MAKSPKAVERDGWTVISAPAEVWTPEQIVANVDALALTDNQVRELTSDLVGDLSTAGSAWQERRRIAHTRRVDRDRKLTAAEEAAERAAERAQARELVQGDRAAVRELNGHAKRPPYHKIVSDGSGQCVECGTEIVAATNTNSGWKHAKSWADILGGVS